MVGRNITLKRLKKTFFWSKRALKILQSRGHEFRGLTMAVAFVL